MYFIFLTSFSSTLPKHLIWCNAHNGFSCKVLDVFSVKRIFSKHRWWARHLDFRITAMRRQSVFSACLQGGERGRRTDSPDTVAALSVVWCTCLRGSYQVNVPRRRSVSTNKGIKTLWSLIISSLLKYATRSWQSQRALAVTHSCHAHRPPAFPDSLPGQKSQSRLWEKGLAKRRHRYHTAETGPEYFCRWEQEQRPSSWKQAELGGAVIKSQNVGWLARGGLGT